MTLRHAIGLPGGSALNSPRPVRLLIADDHRILAEALAMVVRTDARIDLIADPFTSPEAAIEATVASHPDVVLMDIEFGATIDGIEATRQIKQRCPETKVIIVTGHDDEAHLVRAVEAGASGFLDKSEAIANVIDAVDAAARGEALLDPARLARVLQKLAADRERRREADLLVRDLTEREREILQLLAQGTRNDKIADKLHISPHTVQTHVRNILAKLNVHSKLEAVAFAAKHGVVSL